MATPHVVRGCAVSMVESGAFSGAAALSQSLGTTMLSAKVSSSRYFMYSEMPSSGRGDVGADRFRNVELVQMTPADLVSECSRQQYPQQAENAEKSTSQFYYFTSAIEVRFCANSANC